jgi:hypothetical protein
MRGGKRARAGRPPGTLNKKTAELVAVVEATGETPLDYMLRVMRDTSQPHERRDEMAAKAAPYVHARLSNIESKTETTVRYVARVPDKATNPETWQQQHSPEATQH